MVNKKTYVARIGLARYRWACAILIRIDELSVLAWREYVRGTYEMDGWMNRNCFTHDNLHTIFVRYIPTALLVLFLCGETVP
jgi:deoxyribodipyrimidine photolyase-like uncharacterized protein